MQEKANYLYIPTVEKNQRKQEYKGKIMAPKGRGDHRAEPGSPSFNIWSIFYWF